LKSVRIIFKKMKNITISLRFHMSVSLFADFFKMVGKKSPVPSKKLFFFQNIRVPASGLPSF